MHYENFDIFNIQQKKKNNMNGLTFVKRKY